MKIETILKQLRSAKPDVEVRFDFCRISPMKVASWRGIYSEPALGWGFVIGGVKVSELIAELEHAISGHIYSGWKGGDYVYNDQHTLHVDNEGEYTSTEIVMIEDRVWEVIIHTRYEETA